jgi:hypothetical protein
METCPRTGEECLYLTSALKLNERIFVVRDDDRSPILDAEEERMAEVNQFIKKGQELCTEDECGVLAYSSAFAIQIAVAKILGREPKYERRKLEDN